MKPVIVIVFSSEAALEGWFHLNVHIGPHAKATAKPACRIKHDAFEINCVTIRDHLDFDKIRGLKPAMIIEDDSFRPPDGFRSVWLDFVYAYLR